MKVKLTKEEFIKRSMKGEVFELYNCKFFYDKDKTNPFRIEGDDLNGCWSYLDGINEFTVVEPELKTKIVKEWLYKDVLNIWHISGNLLTDEEAKEYFKMPKYKPTGREFEVEDE
jgi:hypothetical protein